MWIDAIPPIICFVLIFTLKMIPVVISTIIATRKDRSEMAWAFLGLFFGWIAVLIVACLSSSSPSSNYHSEELIELKKLLDHDIITQEEFEKKKNELLHL